MHKAEIDCTGRSMRSSTRADLFLHKRFSVSNSGEQAIMPSSREGALPDILFGDEKTSTGVLVGILRAISQKGLQALFCVRSYIDYERWPNIRIQRGVENLVGTVRRMILSGNLKLAEATDEAGLITKRGGRVVIWMASLPVGKDRRHAA